MTVSSTTRSVEYTGNGVTTVFPVTFSFQENSHLVVTQTVGGITSTLVLGTHYSLTGAGAGSGSCTMVTAPAAGVVLRIKRQVPRLQTTDFRSQGSYSPRAHEDALDRGVMLAQELSAADTDLQAAITAGDAAERAALAAEAAALRAEFAGDPDAVVLDTRTVVSTGSTTARSLKDRFAEFANVKDFGAVGDGIADDTAAIQAAIDYVAYSAATKKKGVYIPDGTYKTTNTIHMRYGTDLGSISVVGAGPKASTGFAGTLIKPTFSDRPAINIQGVRKAYLGYLSIFGLNLTKIQTQDETNVYHWRSVAANWVDAALHANADSRYAPYCGIALDAYSGVNNNVPRYPDVTYPAIVGGGAVAQFGKNASSDVVIERVEVIGFVVGFAGQPNGHDGNGEFISFRDCTFGYNKYAISIGHSQCRNLLVYNCRLQRAFIIFSQDIHGAQIGGGQPTFIGCSFDRSRDIFSCNQDRGGAITVKACYAELLDRIGKLGATAANNAPAHFEACTFHFTTDDAGNVETRYVWGGDCHPASFIDCIFQVPRTFGFKLFDAVFLNTFIQLAPSSVPATGFFGAAADVAKSLVMNGSRGLSPDVGGGALNPKPRFHIKGRCASNIETDTIGSHVSTMDMHGWEIGQLGIPADFKRVFPVPRWARLKHANEQINVGPGYDINRAVTALVFTYVSGITWTVDMSAIRTAGSTAEMLIGVGDLVHDLNSDIRFYVASIAAGVLTLVQLSGYKAVAGVASAIADPVPNNNFIRFYSMRTFCAGTFSFVGVATNASPDLTLVGRFDNSIGGFEPVAGDYILSATNLDTKGGPATFAAPAKILAIDVGLRKVTLDKNASRTATIPINFWMRPSS